MTVVDDDVYLSGQAEKYIYRAPSVFAEGTPTTVDNSYLCLLEENLKVDIRCHYATEQMTITVPVLPLGNKA